MAIVVVARTLVREARSKSVAAVTSDAASGFCSYVKWPKSLSATRRPLEVMATEAAGKAWAAMACSIIEKACEKVFSWLPKSRVRDNEEPGVVRFRVRALSLRRIAILAVYSRVARGGKSPGNENPRS